MPRSGPSASLSPWVFSNDTGDGPVGVKTLGKQLSDRQREANGPLRGRSKSTTSLSLPGGRWTAHDLRRTAATFMAALGVSGYVVDECLNHVIESRVRRTYIRDRRIAQQQQAFSALGGF
jgi:integrase